MEGITTGTLIEAGKVLAGAALVVVPLGIKYLKRKAEEKTFTVRKLDCAATIESRIIEMRARLGVDRVAIFEFSNGDKTVMGFPFLYSTMTYERVQDSISSMKGMFNKVPASWFSSLNSHFVPVTSNYGLFYDDGTAILDGAETMTPDVVSILKGYHIVSNCIFKISNNIGDGLLIISDHKKKLVFTKEEIAQIKGDTNYIANIMNQRPK